MFSHEAPLQEIYIPSTWEVLFLWASLYDFHRVTCRSDATVIMLKDGIFVMDGHVFGSLTLFAVASLVTPGPNNLLIFASAVHFGIKRSWPHLLGVAFGFFVELWACGLGLDALFRVIPVARQILKILGGAYLIYLAIRIATSPVDPSTSTHRKQPMTFTEAALFQIVNPKSWVIALGGIALYTDAAHPFKSMLIVSIFLGVATIPAVGVWALAGIMMKTYLSHPRRLRYFNVAMGMLLVAAVLPMLHAI